MNYKSKMLRRILAVTLSVATALTSLPVYANELYPSETISVMDYENEAKSVGELGSGLESTPDSETGIITESETGIDTDSEVASEPGLDTYVLSDNNGEASDSENPDTATDEAPGQATASEADADSSTSADADLDALAATDADPATANDETSDLLADTDADTQDPNEAPVIESITYVNPAYRDVVTEEEIEAAALEAEQARLAALEAAGYTEEEIEELGASSKHFDSTKAAADYFRSQMVARQNTITYAIKGSGSSSKYQSVFNETISSIYDQAFQETDSPKEGDYIYANWKGYRVSCVSENYRVSGSNFSCYFVLTYSVNYWSTAAQEAEIDALINKLMSPGGELYEAKQSGDDYTKVLEAYKYLTQNHITYDNSLSRHSSYDALITHLVVCQGYASSLYRLLREMGISARYVTGDAGGAHGWTIARVGNLYYDLDATWDTTNYPGGYSYFLLGEPDFSTDHHRDKKYLTEDFYEDYPMSSKNYDSSSAGTTEGKDNPSITLTDIDGKTVTTENHDPDRVKIVVCFGYRCGNSMYTAQSMAGSELVNSDKVDVLFIHNQLGDDDTVRAFADAYAPGCNYSWAQNGYNNSYSKYKNAIDPTSTSNTLPIVAIIDGNNKIVFGSIGKSVSASTIEAVLKKYLKIKVDGVTIDRPEYDGKDLTLTWSGVSGASSYNVYRCRINPATNNVVPYKLKNVTGTSYTIKNIEKKYLDYFYGVRAVSASGTEGDMANAIQGLAPIALEDLTLYKAAQVLSANSVTECMVGDKIKLNAKTTPADANDFESVEWIVSGDVDSFTLAKSGINNEYITVTPKQSGEIHISAKAETANSLDGFKTVTHIIKATNPTVTLKLMGGEINGSTEDIVITVDYKTTPDQIDSLLKGIVAATVNEGDGGAATRVAPTRDGYVFLGWSTREASAGDVTGKSGDIISSTPITADTTLYACWRSESADAFQISAPDMTYTGTALKYGSVNSNGEKQAGTNTDGAVLTVFDGFSGEPLTEGVDYTVSYKNNINVAKKNDANPPTVIVKGKGYYTGSTSQAFDILPRDIEDDDVYISNNYVAYNKGQAVKVAPVLKLGSKTLVKDKDYTLTIEKNGKEVTECKSIGTYDLIIKAVEGGNFTGTREEKFIVTSVNPMSKTKVTVKSVKYVKSDVVSINGIWPDESQITVKYGKTTLKMNEDYRIQSVINNKAPGTATVILEGIPNSKNGTGYIGTVRKNFTITGTKLSSAKVENATVTYTGQAQTIPVNNLLYIVNKDGTRTSLKEGEDYTITNWNAIKNKLTDAGTVKLTCKGIGEYTGTKTVSFKILPFAINESNATVVIKGIDGKETNTVPYDKGGAKPQVELKVKTGKTTVTLVAGVSDPEQNICDLNKNAKLKYSSNNKLESASALKAPTVTLTGKGNFKGTVKKTFGVSAGVLSTNSVVVSANDLVYKDNPGNFKTKITVTTRSGAKLKENTDYTVTYKSSTGKTLADTDQVKLGDTVYFSIQGKGLYDEKSVLSPEWGFRIVSADLSKAKVKVVSAPSYTNGKDVDISAIKLKVTINGEEIDSKYYVIDPDPKAQYSLPGKSSIIIRASETGKTKGIGGEKKVGFTIGKRKWYNW